MGDLEDILHDKYFDEMMQSFYLSQKEYREKRKELEQERSGILTVATLVLAVFDALLDNASLPPDRRAVFFHERERLDMFIERSQEED